MFVPVDRREPGGQRVIAVYDEEWEPDEWGDPGQFVRRRLVTIEGLGAPGMMARLSKEAGGHWALRPEEPAGLVEWWSGGRVRGDIGAAIAERCMILRSMKKPRERG